MESQTRWTWVSAGAEEVVGVSGRRTDVEREGAKGRVSSSGETEGCCESLDDSVVWVWASACAVADDDATGMSPPAMVKVSLFSAIVIYELGFNWVMI